MSIRHVFMPVMACATLSGAFFPACAQAQGWIETVAPAYRAANVVAARVVRNEVNDTFAMIHCAAGDVRLVLGGTGGEPPEGESIVSAGQVRARTIFIPDPAMSKLTGNPTTSAMVPGDLLGEMAKSRSLSVVTTMRFGNGQVSNQTRTTPLSGFGRLMPVLRQECLGEVRQAARAQPVEQPAPRTMPPKPAQRDGFDDILDDLGGKPSPEVAPRTPAQLPAAARKLLAGYAQSCRDTGGRNGAFRGKGVYIADLNGDGVLDYVYYLGDYSCPGGMPGAGFCGASGGCSVDVVMSAPQGHREVEGWIGIYDVSIARAGNQEILALTNNVRGNAVITRHRWNGRAFVRM
jgi:hypothetical protein